MSEYEIAALALAEEEAIRDAVGIMQTYIALLLESNVMFVSIFSGYLAIVYFLGAKLTRDQAVGVSVFIFL